MPRENRNSAASDLADVGHNEATRRNKPPVGLATTYETWGSCRTSYAYDLHLGLQFRWAGKLERTPFAVGIVSLHV